ncbi:MAG: DUF1667 domain-containing protein [Treponema sp.]|nr:DUF1667 domain-containing protein [Treponema sp.]
MRNLTCIVCPVGCSLDVNETQNGLSVTGYTCSRGEVYALEEIRAPKRVVTATAPIETDKTNYVYLGSVRRIPIKTAVPCPRSAIPALLQDIYKTKVALPVKIGDVIISGWKPTQDSLLNEEPFWQSEGIKGIDIIITRTVS